MTANFSTIRAGIKAIVAADVDLAQGEVYDYEPPISEVTADPWAAVVASENESEYETTSENLRRYGFTVRIFVERNTRGAAAAETLLVAIVDRLLQAFDVSNTFGVDGVLMTKAAPSQWAYIIAEKEYRMAEIKLSTAASVDVSS